MANRDHNYTALGKYDSARDDILHFMCMSDWANESFGESDYGVWAWKLSNDAADVSIDNTEFSSLLDEWRSGNPEVIDSPALRAELVGHFIVSSNDQGFVYVAAYDAERIRDAEYSAAESNYNDWATENDGE